MPDMPPFNRWSRLEEISTQMGQRLTAMIDQAHREGARDGIEMAAQMCEATVAFIRALPEINEGHCAQIAMAEFLRDQARLMAHQIPDVEGT
jgi:hypothetical protein